MLQLLKWPSTNCDHTHTHTYSDICRPAYHHLGQPSWHYFSNIYNQSSVLRYAETFNETFKISLVRLTGISLFDHLFFCHSGVLFFCGSRHVQNKTGRAGSLSCLSVVHPQSCFGEVHCGNSKVGQGADGITLENL